uniref:Ig-like domain-containing protein n=1 Tax=Xenopus tropicalis TaxID=8364 RepID=A0A803JBB4_XENTR
MKEMNNSLHRLLLIVSAAMLLVSYVSGNECQCQIHVKKNTTYRQVIEESLVMKCPVSFCTRLLPQVTWCRFYKDQCEPITAGPRVTLGWANKTENSAVYSLTIVSVQLNDTGYYRCSARNGQIVGRTVVVHISETDDTSKTNITTVSTIREQTNGSPDNKDKGQKWFYLIVFPTLASLCLIIMVSSALIYCLRGRKAKHRRQRALANKETGYETSLEHPQNDQDQPQEEDPTYSSLNMAAQETITDATYDNASMLNNWVAPTGHSEEQDSIIYADLNHDTSRIKAKNQYVDDGQIEYAMVCMRT